MIPDEGFPGDEHLGDGDAPTGHDWADAIATTIARATEQIGALNAARREPPPYEDAAMWLSTPPTAWPATPPIEVWALIDALDPQLRFEVPEGHLCNLLDEAMGILEGLGLVTVPQPPGTGTG